MSIRYCIYKDCENFINLTDRSINKHVKLFSFPKNPERRQKWIEYGQVPLDLPPTKYYFCSDHFDKKFLGVTNRRTTLVGEAVPFPYVEPEMDNNFQTNYSLDNYLYKMYKDKESPDNLETDNEQDLDMESTTTVQDDDHNGHQRECTNNLSDRTSETEVIIMDKIEESNEIVNCHKRTIENAIILIEPSSSKPNKTNTAFKSFNRSNDKNEQTINIKKANLGLTTTLDGINEEIYEEHFSIDIENLEEEHCTPIRIKDKPFAPKAYKRKFEDNNLTEAPLSRAKISKTSPSVKILEKYQNTNEEEKVSVESIETEDEEVDLENLVDIKHVSTFIYNGEEYVQMPKAYYVREKIEIAKKFQKMVRTVKAIKEYINSLDV